MVNTINIWFVFTRLIRNCADKSMNVKEIKGVGRTSFCMFGDVLCPVYIFRATLGSICINEDRRFHLEWNLFWLTKPGPA